MRFLHRRLRQSTRSALRSYSFHGAQTLLRYRVVPGVSCLHCTGWLPGSLGLAARGARGFAETGGLARGEVWPRVQPPQAFAVPWQVWGPGALDSWQPILPSLVTGSLFCWYHRFLMGCCWLPVKPFDMIIPLGLNMDGCCSQSKDGQNIVT